jgi:hypothetical protein
MLDNNQLCVSSSSIEKGIELDCDRCVTLDLDSVMKFGCLEYINKREQNDVSILEDQSQQCQELCLGGMISCQMMEKSG